MASNKLSSAIPTELGNLVEVGGAIADAFSLETNSLSLAIPTQLGQMSAKMAYSFRVHSNKLSSSVPTELGHFVKMVTWFSLEENSLSGTLPYFPTSL